MSDMKPTMQCPTCEGTGRAPLPEALQETLNVMPKKGTFTAADLQSKIPSTVTVNAMNNRLESLRDLGMVKRERNGKFWNYSRI